MATQEYNERLWFTHQGCSGTHFVVGNPHTFPGRMLGWCLLKQRSFFFSKNEIEECSPETAAWVEGFLAGNEPSPPKNGEGDVEFASPQYKSWLANMQAFRECGFLDVGGGDSA
ncbi:hypothetical protein [Piscinibacter gummiphilus]|uniref:hypothetical protein n=1 Tax=Piscinibacter gummiphilus TaxID=946333 RepID=UPI0012F4D29B|nr:hypothetical protein [Piscinibacter gummiphilus]GLS93875.1 hypothetical protein GCM10007918_11670 [Piscinibacter gummiphilus]